MDVGAIFTFWPWPKKIKTPGGNLDKMMMLGYDNHKTVHLDNFWPWIATGTFFIIGTFLHLETVITWHDTRKKNNSLTTSTLSGPIGI